MIKGSIPNGPQRTSPSSPVVKTSSSISGGMGLIPGWGAKIPHASWPKKSDKSNIVTNSIKTFKWSTIFKKSFKKKGPQYTVRIHMQKWINENVPTELIKGIHSTSNTNQLCINEGKQYFSIPK